VRRAAKRKTLFIIKSKRAAAANAARDAMPALGPGERRHDLSMLLAAVPMAG